MQRKVTAWIAGLTAVLLIFIASALGSSEKRGISKTILVTPNVIVGTVTPEGKPTMTVVVIKGRDAKHLKESCGCTSAVYPELNLVILLNDDMEI